MSARDAALDAGTGRGARTLLLLSVVAGSAALVWAVHATGPAALAAHAARLGWLLPVMAVCQGGRFACQAWGWRRAMPLAARPPLAQLFGAVVAGEGVGYLSWGPLTREPTKVAYIADRVPRHTALAAALLERAASCVAAASLIGTGFVVGAVRTGLSQGARVAVALCACLATVTLLVRWLRRVPRPDGAAGARDAASVLAFAAAQEGLNIAEAWVVLMGLGMTPSVGDVVVLEGASRLVNLLGQFVPARVGVAEVGTAVASTALQLGTASGMALALGRRLRALAWSACGLWLAARRSRHQRAAGLVVGVAA